MTLFSIQNLCLNLRNIRQVKENLVREKYNFCINFEKEMDMSSGSYSEDIFDFLYNIYSFSKFFDQRRFNQIISDFMGFDFFKFREVSDYISSIYTEMIMLNRDYFYKLFKFNHDDPKYISQKFIENYKENIEKINTLL